MVSMLIAELCAIIFRQIEFVLGSFLGRLLQCLLNPLRNLFPKLPPWSPRYHFQLQLVILVKPASVKGPATNSKKRRFASIGASISMSAQSYDQDSQEAEDGALQPARAVTPDTPSPTPTPKKRKTVKEKKKPSKRKKEKAVKSQKATKGKARTTDGSVGDPEAKQSGRQPGSGNYLDHEVKCSQLVCARN